MCWNASTDASHKKLNPLNTSLSGWLMHYEGEIGISLSSRHFGSMISWNQNERPWCGNIWIFPRGNSLFANKGMYTVFWNRECVILLKWNFYILSTAGKVSSTCHARIFSWHNLSCIFICIPFVYALNISDKHGSALLFYISWFCQNPKKNLQHCTVLTARLYLYFLYVQYLHIRVIFNSYISLNSISLQTK